MTVDDVYEAIDDIRIDWGDMEVLRAVGDEILTEVSSDRELLTSLLIAARDDESAVQHHEVHRLLNKLHLYESPTNGVRLRLHVSTLEHRDRPHDHRWSFCSRILHGQYVHTRHELRADFSGIPDAAQNDSESVRVPAKAKPMFQVVQSAGSLYALHHDEIHTTFTTPNTVSLFLRGPAQKDRSIIIERSTASAWWRYGRADEPNQRRQKVAMSTAVFDSITDELRLREVIN